MFHHKACDAEFENDLERVYVYRLGTRDQGSSLLFHGIIDEHFGQQAYLLKFSRLLPIIARALEIVTGNFAENSSSCLHLNNTPRV